MQPQTSFAGQEVSEAPRTTAAKFVITPLDVGSEAVRAGHMADLEERHQVLLLSAKLVLERIRKGGVAIGAPYEFALQAAIQVAESK